VPPFFMILQARWWCTAVRGGWLAFSAVLMLERGGSLPGWAGGAMPRRIFPFWLWGLDS